jgi:trans-aconitate 2-methyltransferase
MPRRAPIRPAYTFGDGHTAGERLALLASVFDPTTAAFLGEAVTDRPRLALDLGCGPGFTTRLLAGLTGAERTVGLDASGAFVRRARMDAPAGMSFEVHDVTHVPFPVSGADLVFARYLLAHLPHPLVLVREWAAQTAPGGHLVLEEIEDIHTDCSAFDRYLRIVGSMMASRHGDLHVGRVLRDAPPPPGSRTVTSRAATIEPSASVAARMFRLNLDNWRHDPWVVENWNDRALADLAHELDALATVPNDRFRIVWTHRQLVYARC